MEQTVVEILTDISGADEGEIELDTELFEEGVLDSFGIVQLFVELEERLGVKLDTANLQREDISTAAKITALCEAVRG
ncbi:MAG: D-alanine--poly(phosphoribitol) ligase subunit DltC [Oscillospiraceae bacterium]|nr:D-alanine--poly(phosphoribitol) ligase subunit DltC [Oscillospiraceae bacterium]MBQ5749529.1 D-alanine--poly(phosphoribitol) ligase subunit DltC [Oscillospiraceae bacterium]